MSYLSQNNQIELEISNLTSPVVSTILQTKESAHAKRRKLLIAGVRAILDFGLVYIAFLFSFFLRFNWLNFDGSTLRPAELAHYLGLGSSYSFITIVLLILSRIFLSSSKSGFVRSFFITAGVVMTSIVFITFLQLLDPPAIFFSRLVFIYLAPVVWLTLIGEIFAVSFISHLRYQRKVQDALFVSYITKLKGTDLKPFQKTPGRFLFFIKRVVDVIGAMTFLVLFSILLVFIALAIKLNSKGPIIFRQIRVGKDGKHFTFYKFRSMYMDADERILQLQQFNETNGATFKMKNDPRVTRVGRILRRTSLDEIPQLLNVLLGDMSLVGPRPGIPREVMRYAEWQRRRLEVIPGLTGLWQVSGRSNIGFEDMTKLDIYYIDNYSLFLDIKILFKTITTVLTGKGAY